MNEYTIKLDNDRFSRISFFERKKNSNSQNYLDFSFKNLGDSDILKIFKENHLSLSNIRTLYLGVNQITHYGVSIISNFLIWNSHLQHLSLESNFIGDIGCVSLANMLQKNSTLVSLIIGGNSIGDMGIIEISNSLRSNRSLKNLVLVNNSLSQLSISSIIETLKLNKTLTRLSLGFRANSNVTDEFNKIFDYNTTLLDCSMEFDEYLDSLKLGYNLNFNRFLENQRPVLFQTSTSFFIHHFLVAFYKSIFFNKIIPLEILADIAFYTGVTSPIFIRSWEQDCRLKWKKKYFENLEIPLQLPH